MSTASNIGIQLTLKGAEQVKQGLKTISGSAAEMARQFEASRGAILTTAAAVATAAGIMVDRVSNAAAEIERFAMLAGSTPQEFQRMAVGAKSAGMDMEKYASTIKDVQDKIGDFLQTGGGELKDFFEKIAPAVGVTAEQFKNLSGPQALQLFYNSLEKANLSQKETVFWMESIADDSTTLVPLLQNNGAAFDALADRAAKYGGVLSDYALAAAKDFKGQTDEMTLALQGAEQILAVGLMPTLTETARELLATADSAGIADTAATVIRTTLETLVVVASDVAFTFTAVGREIGGLAAQAQAFLSLDFARAGQIRAMMKEDAAGARSELEAFQARLLNAGQTAKDVFNLSGVMKANKAGTAEYNAALGALIRMKDDGTLSASQYTAAIKGATAASGDLGNAETRTANAAAVAQQRIREEFKSTAEKRNEALDKARKAFGGMIPPDIEKQIREKFKEPLSDSAKAAASSAKSVKQAYESAFASAEKQARELVAEEQNLNAAEKALADVMAGEHWGKWNEAQRKAIELIYQRNAATIARQKQEEADAKWASESADANANVAESAYEAANAAEAQRDAQLQANAAIGLTALEVANLEAARIDDTAAEKQRLAAIMEGIDPAIAADYRRQAQALTDLAQAKRDGAVKDAMAETAKEAADEWKRTADKIEDSLIDALMDGGKSGAEYIEGLFRTMVLRPVLQAIVSPVAGAVTSALGFSGAAQAGQAGGGLGSLSSLNTAYSAITTGIRSSIASGFDKLVTNGVGEKLGLSYYDGNTYQTTGLGEQFSGVAQGLGSAMTAYGVQKSLSGGYKTGASGLVDSATAIGGFFDPTGGLIAGAIGGTVNRAFGRKLKDQGLEGTFGGADGFDGNSYEFYKGGWFRSDKTKRKPLDAGVEDALETQFKALQTQTALMAQTLGLGVDSVVNFTSKIKVSFKGLSEEQISQRMAEEFGKVGEAMAQAALGQTEYARSGETAVETLTRLSSSLTTANGTFDVLGQKLLDTSLAGADMASQLVDLMGGLEQFTATTASYLENFYTEAERTELATRQLTEALAAIGVDAMPATREAFRALVESQDLTTESGRETYAALMGLSGAFAALVPVTDDLTEALAETQTAIKDVFQELRDAIQGARDDVQSAFDTINGPKTPRDFAQLTTAVSAVDVTAPSSASVTTAKSALEQAKNKPQYLIAAESYAEYWANLQAGTQTAFESAQQQAAQTQGAVDARWQYVWNWSGGDRGSWQTYRDQINAGTWWEHDSDFAGDYGKSFQDWYNETTQLQGIANEAGLARTNAASVNDSAIAQKSEAQASANTANAAWQSSITAAQDALTAAENDYLSSITGWVSTAKVSVETLSALKDETLAYYEAQQQLSDGMRQSAANLRAAAQEAMRQTLSTDTALGLRLADFDRAYTLAMSTGGAEKAGYADQMAAALPQLSQDIAAQSSTRADWQVAVAKLANQSSTVAAQLEAQAPVNLQEEANRVLGLIDGKLADLNAASVSAEQVIATAVNAGAARTATGLQEIVKALTGETASASFAVGGYTGPGGKYEAAGVVHRGEVVFSQDDIARLGGVRAVEAIRTGEMPGYATGGTVGAPVVVPAPVIPGRVAMAPRPAAATPDPEQQERDAQARDQAQREAQQQTQDLIAQLRQVNSNLSELKRSVDKSGQSNDQMNNKIFNMADTTVKLLRKFDALGLPVVQAATEAVA